MRKNYLFLLIIILYAAPLFSAVIYVKPNGNGNGNGTSWGQAYGSLTAALQNAQSGDEIWVAQGTYKPTANNDTSISFIFKNGVKVYGGFNGTETTVAQRADATGTTTILSGRLTDAIRSKNILKINNAPSSLNLIDGLTVEGASWIMSSPVNGGAGIQILNSTISLKNLNVRNNSLFMNNMSPASSNNLVGGAGIFSKQSVLKLENVNIVDNMFTMSADTYQNLAHGGGAGIFMQTGTLEYKKGMIDGNDLTINNVLSNGGGGGYFESLSTIYIEGVTISNNKTLGTQESTGGGLFFLTNQNVTLVNNIFHGNSSALGGRAIALYFTPTAVINNTFGRNNHENVDPSPINVRTYFSAVHFDNCAFLERIENIGNAAVAFNNCITRYAINYGTINNVTSGIMDFINPLMGNYTPKACSPYLNMGNSTYITVTTDQRGNPRIAGSAVDFGAVELNNNWTNRVYVDASSTNTYRDGATWATAYTDLADALDCGCVQNNVSTHPAEVWVAQGTYRHRMDRENPYQIFNALQTFKLKNNQKLYGGFQNGATSLTDRDITFATRQTILSGAVEGNNVYNVVTANNTNTTAEFNGFIIQDGRATPEGGNIMETSGGGILVKDGKATLKNLWIRNNSAKFNGGGIGFYDAGAEMDNVKLTNNQSLSMGGAISFFHVESPSPPISNITNLEVANNNASFGGGAISIEEFYTVNIDGFSAHNNTVDYYGGAFYIEQCNLNIKRGSIDQNTTNMTNGVGGAFFTSGVTATDCNIYAESIVFSRNTAARGGAVTIWGGNLDTTNCTFVENVASVTGNLFFSLQGGSFDIKNSILDHTNSSVPDVAEYYGTQTMNPAFTIQRSLVTDNFSTIFNNLGNMMLNTNPLFINKPNQNYQLTACGPPVDAGLNSYLSAGAILDAADNSRIKNNLVDLGALEYQYIDPAFQEQPDDLTVDEGSPASFQVASVTEGITYQWQVSTNNGLTWTPISGATAAVLNINPATLAMDGNLYRCIISDCTNSETSTAGTLNVDELELSVPETGNLSGILLYPNPGSGHFTIKMQNATADGSLIVYDIQGRHIYEKAITAQEIQLGTIINSSSWASGAYFICWKGEKQYVLRFIKFE